MSGFNLGDILVTFKARTEDLKSGINEVKGMVSAVQTKVNGTSFRAFASNASSAFGSVADTISNVVTKVALLATLGSVGIGTFVKTAADLQTTNAQFKALIGNGEQANKIFGQLYNYTLGKPIAFPDAAKAAQTLLGYGISAENVLEHMKTLSKLSVVNGADMQLLANAYGQVNARGKLFAQDALQLINNKVPITTTIARQLGVSVEQVSDLMSEGKISAETFNKALASLVPDSAMAEMTNTFNNRMISMQGSLRSFGLRILGIKIDPIKGLVIQTGGLFDIISNGLVKAAKALKDMAPKITAVVQYLVKNGKTVIAVVAGIAAAFVTAKLGAIAFGIASTIATGGVNLIVPAIVALVAALAFLQVKFNVFGRIMKALKPIIDPVVLIFKEMFRILGEQLAPIIKYVQDHMEAFKKVGTALLLTTLIPIALAATAIVAGFAILVGAIIAVVYVFNKLVEAGQWVWKHLKDGFESISKAAEESFQKIKALYDRYLKPTLDKISDKIKEVQKVWDDFKANIGRSIDSIKSYLGSIKETFKSNLGAISDAIKPFKENFWGALKDTLKGAAQAMIDYDVDTLKRWKDNLTKSYESVKSWGGDVLKSIGDSVDKFGKKISDWLGDLPTRFTNWLNQTVDSVSQWGSDLSTKMQEKIDNAVATATEIFKNFPDKVMNALSNLPERISNFFTTTFDNLKAMFSQKGTELADTHVEGIKSGITLDKLRKVGDLIVGGFLLVIATSVIYFVDGGIRLINAMVNGMASVVGRAAGVAANIGGSILGKINSFIGDAFNAGWNIATGLANGIANGAGQVIQTIKNICASALSAVKKFFGIKSPSRVMEGEVGGQMMAGWGNGLVKGVKGVVRAAKSASGAVLDGFQGMADVGSANIALTATAGYAGGAVLPYNSQQGGSQSSVENRTYITGDFYIADQQTADYVLRKLSRDQELAAKAITTQSGALGR